MKINPIGRVKSVVLQWLGMPLDRAGWQKLGIGGWGSFTGEAVTTEASLRLSTVWACVRLISETLATLPLGFYMRKPDGSRKMAVDHQLYFILHTQPNADNTAVTFWEVVAASMLLWGNTYVEIGRDASGGVISLNFLMPQNITPPRLGDTHFSYRDPRTREVRQIAMTDVMHIPAFSIDGICGLSPVAYGMNVMGQAITTDRASAAAFAQGMRASGFVKSPDTLKEKQREDIKKSLEAFRGTEGAGRVMVLEAGMAFEALSMNPADAQMLESRNFNIEEICRWFRVPPFMVGHSEKSTSWGTGIEQQMIGFITFVLRPWCVRIEQAISKSLLKPVERARYFAEFSLDGLMRGDSAARAAFYAVMVNNGILTRDEVRGLENWPAKGVGANLLTVQSAMIPLDMIGKQPAPAPAPAPAAP